MIFYALFLIALICNEQKLEFFNEFVSNTDLKTKKITLYIPKQFEDA